MVSNAVVERKSKRAAKKATAAAKRGRKRKATKRGSVPNTEVSLWDVAALHDMVALLVVSLLSLTIFLQTRELQQNQDVQHAYHGLRRDGWCVC